MDGCRTQSFGHQQDLQRPRQIVEPSFGKGTTRGVPMWKWQQEIAPNHLLCYTNEQLDQKQHFGVMVPLESLDEPQLWVEGCVRDHWMSKEAL